MARFQPFGRRDDPSLEEGDDVFTGFRSRVQPAALPPGLARYLGNMRCDRGTLRPRKGTKAISTALTLANPAIVLDFTLPTATGIYEVYDDQVRGSAVIATPGNVEGVILAATDSAYAYGAAFATLDLTNAADAVVTDSDGHTIELYHPAVASTQPIAEIAYPAGETVEATDACHLEQFLNQVYLFRGYQTADAFSLTGITRSSTTATATADDPHGRTTGDWVDVQGADDDEYNGIFQITVTNATQFTYTVTGTPATPTTGTLTARPCKPVLSWDMDPNNAFVVVPSGYHPTGGTKIRMPAAAWGIHFNRRWILPYGKAPTEHILGDFGEAATFDTQYAQLRILPGGIDWMVGALPYQLLRYLVLYRKSVHQVELSNTTGTPVAIREITRAFGCAARKSIANCGDVILWLSDQGVTGVQMVDQLNVVPLSLPLSDRINDQIEAINWAAAAAVRAIFWQNRYYLAVPTGDSERNNTVLVFNFLNRGGDAPLGEWESIDTFRGDFDVQEFLVLDYAGQKRLHAATSFGYIFLLEEGEADEWASPSSALGTYPIIGTAYLRDFRLGTRERKRFCRAQLSANLTAADAYSVAFVARNPDRTVTIQNYTAAATSDVHSHLRVPGVRGAAGTLEITTSAGRPEIRSISLEATVADRTTSTRV
jgi:hypothetical protein